MSELKIFLYSMTIDATAIIILVLSQFCKLQIAKFAKTKGKVCLGGQIATISYAQRYKTNLQKGNIC